MEKYIIKLNVFTCNNKGIRVSDYYEKEYNEVTPFKSRLEAVKEIKRITSIMIGESLGFGKVDDVLKFFMIDLVFSPKKGIEYKIFGDKELMVSSLVKEANYYRKKRKAN
ncbi:hypothetical protein ADIWIN_1474 [Winogradskyella psychrotolerans RS-3]|uniref:Uncharacterized protein n=1 Tax=Winogradskyella psychrotolerans RS-3 TaxID=641526 RepID=S7X335_9FLAO|nr:hypothetical protein [Winogradskyella psychrotolerans]EPR73444.1 hypothetical protein ADIWIN_1474 [Winogradskyella psychrotolerans RS-3]